MTQNVLQFWPEIWAVLGAIFILTVFAIEEIHADGYIDSFAKDIEEAGGGMPPLVKVALVGIILWWLVYLVLNWTAG
jgi:hypothetical protein